MYWSVDEKIQRANLDGTDIEDFFTGLELTVSLTIDKASGKIYWTTYPPYGVPRKIQRANLDGTDVEDFISISNTIAGIDVDPAGGFLYWMDASAERIQRTTLDGANTKILIDFQGSINGPHGIAIDTTGGKMYWTIDDKIQRANLNGTDIESLVTGLAGARGIALGPENPIPEPTTLCLMGFGLLGLLGVVIRQRRRRSNV